MAHSKLIKLAVLAAAATTAVAFEDILIDDVVQADEEVEVTFVNDLDSSDSFDGMFEKFTVFVATTPPGWGTGPACYLVNATDIDTTSLKVKIPASMAPDGSVLQISTMEFNEDPAMDGPSGFQYSNEFTLEGGTGEWSEAELSGSNIGLSTALPCSAYACARECVDKFYPEYLEDDEAYASAYKCTRECDGVDMPSWAVLNGEEDEGADGDDEDADGEDESGTEEPSGTEDADEASSTEGTTDATDAPGAAGHVLASLPLSLLGTVVALYYL